MWCACGQSECDSGHDSGRHLAKAEWPWAKGKPGGRNCLCKCDLAGYEMEICIPEPVRYTMQGITMKQVADTFVSVDSVSTTLSDLEKRRVRRQLFSARQLTEYRYRLTKSDQFSYGNTHGAGVHVFLRVSEAQRLDPERRSRLQRPQISGPQCEHVTRNDNIIKNNKNHGIHGNCQKSRLPLLTSVIS